MTLNFFDGIDSSSNGFAPLKLDFNDFVPEPDYPDANFEDQFDRMNLQAEEAVNGAPGHVSDYPSLRDLETSNAFSGVNHHFNIQRHLDQSRLERLEVIGRKFE